jgi:phosphatidylserine decarboxylase
VIVVRRTENAGWVGEPALQISIFLSLFDVHVNRYPVGGTVEYVDYSPGRFEPAWRETASSRNERLEVGIRTDEGVRVLVRQVAGLVARRIVNPSRVGQRVQRGDRMGMIRFGSRTDLFLPAAARASVRGGDRAVGGVTVLAELP